MGRVDRQSAPSKIVHGFHLAAPEEPKQRTMGVDGQHAPLDAIGHPRQQGPPQTDGCAGAQAFSLPSGTVAEGDVDTFVLKPRSRFERAITCGTLRARMDSMPADTSRHTTATSSATSPARVRDSNLPA